MNSRYTIHLVDDDEAVREGLSLLFEAHGFAVAAFRDSAHLLAEFDANNLGPLLIDLNMPQVTGLELHTQLLQRGVEWPVIVITGDGDIHSCRAAFRSGVVDFLTKPIDEKDLFAALKKAERALDTLRERDDARILLGRLTPREREILDLVCRGFGTKDISSGLAISARTVDNHRANICDKLGTTSAVELLQIMQAAQ
ncbi:MULTISPECIES: response regulator transcription factor [Rhizobium/Agrobacterium group]|uniref:response regulator transcription factor n=1 Tax=Rhizobium/Agrobacterium group TaxID=227290 RepID=UPI0023004987|nr:MULTISPECIES: response regulator [Rhizobium/Agrobacterium group]MDA5633681.1 response regulator [Agrobacterium sp. ST15.16.024]MDF1889327.1 response regulator [Rhizobium rhizogenes]